MSEEDQGFTVLLDEAELTVRFIEAVYDVPREARRPGMQPIAMLDALEAHGGRYAVMVSDFRNCARAAMQYFSEQVAGGVTPPDGRMTLTWIERDGGKPN